MCAVNLCFFLISYKHHHYENVKRLNHEHFLWT